jgi:hypothetical protein
MKNIDPRCTIRNIQITKSAKTCAAGVRISRGLMYESALCETETHLLEHFLDAVLHLFSMQNDQGGRTSSRCGKK